MFISFFRSYKTLTEKKCLLDSVIDETSLNHSNTVFAIGHSDFPETRPVLDLTTEARGKTTAKEEVGALIIIKIIFLVDFGQYLNMDTIYLTNPP